MIEINKQILLANSQRYAINSVKIEKDEFTKLWKAQVEFNVYNENGDFLYKKYLDYPIEEFDNFWNNFNNGTFLYEELSRKENLNVQIQNSESEFING